MEAASSSSQENKDYAPNDDDKKDVLLDHMDIAITESEKREAGALNYRDFYIVYLIETKVTDPGWTGALSRISTIWRRYSEFEALRQHLAETYPYLVLPPLPEKTFEVSDKCSDKRRAGLETFLLRCGGHPAFTRDPVLMGFLQAEDSSWKQALKVTGYWQLAEHRLKSLSSGPRQPDEALEASRLYATELRRNLAGLARANARIAERRANVRRLYGAQGCVLSEWSACENLLGDTLQQAGHRLDSLAADAGPSFAEQEDSVAGQLQEYALYADSLACVCQAHAALMGAVGRSQALLEATAKQREQVSKGQGSLVSRFFGGAIDSEEVREAKCRALEQKIEEGNAAVDQAKLKLEEFSTLAAADHSRFQTQKVADLHDTLASHVKLQAKLCRKDLLTWKHIRDCFEAIP